jgi:hypothetical protein
MIEYQEPRWRLVRTSGDQRCKASVEEGLELLYISHRHDENTHTSHISASLTSIFQNLPYCHSEVCGCVALPATHGPPDRFQGFEAPHGPMGCCENS